MANISADELHQLMRQPEGLRLDFKREFYHLEQSDQRVRERQWGELIKDVLALANGNINTAGQTAYLIFGVGDGVRPDGSRQVFDVGPVTYTRTQLLNKINSFCSPPLADLRCDLVLYELERLFVITIPASAYLHEITRRIETSSGTTFPEHTIFIRRGDGVQTASLLEVQAILDEKKERVGTRNQHTVPKVYPSNASPLIESVRPAALDRFGLVVIALYSLSIAIWSADTTSPSSTPPLMSFMLGSFMGGLLGLLIAGLLSTVRTMIRSKARLARRNRLLFWGPTVLLGLTGAAATSRTSELLFTALMFAILGGIAGIGLVALSFATDGLSERVDEL